MKLVLKLTNESLNLFLKRIFSSNSRFCRGTMSTYSDQVGDSEVRSDHFDRTKKILEFIPKLTSNLHKGQCGRIGVIGGSVEYTGAPFFAAISALKLGADIVYVFSCKEAAPVIKSYSPELIVHPILDCIDAVKKIEPWLGRLHVLLIGPGMGRDPGLLKNVGDIITFCKENIKPAIPLVIDADGLFLVTENLSLIKNYKGPLILTPNIGEYNRLANKTSEISSMKIAAKLNALIIQKGVRDVIVNGMHNTDHKFGQELMCLACDVAGSQRRCGGQGDILAGCLATFVAWLEIFFKHNANADCNSLEQMGSKIKAMDWFVSNYLRYSLAAYGACTVTRTSSRLAFEEHGRGMTASDMIGYVQKAFRMHFEPGFSKE